MTTDEKLDALARDVAVLVDTLADHCSRFNQRQRADELSAMYARHARPTPEARRWWVVSRSTVTEAVDEASALLAAQMGNNGRVFDRPHRAILAKSADDARVEYDKGVWFVVGRDVVVEAADKDHAHLTAARFNQAAHLPTHRAIFATSAADARAQYAAMEGYAVKAEPAGVPDDGHNTAYIADAHAPPSDGQDAAGQLVELLTQLDAWYRGDPNALTTVRTPSELLDLAREVVRQRDEARREARALRDIVTAINAACDEVAPDNVAHIVGADVVDDTAGRWQVQGEDGEPIIDASTVPELVRQLSRAWFTASEVGEREKARADAAEATVRELRKLCGEAARFCWGSLPPSAGGGTLFHALYRAAAAGEGVGT